MLQSLQKVSMSALHSLKCNTLINIQRSLIKLVLIDTQINNDNLFEQLRMTTATSVSTEAEKCTFFGPYPHYAPLAEGPSPLAENHSPLAEK